MVEDQFFITEALVIMKNFFMKRYVLLLFTLSTTFIFAMENNKSFSLFPALYSYVVSFFVEVESESKKLNSIVALRASKNKFETQLKAGNGRRGVDESVSSYLKREISLININCYPKAFLTYCYYQKYHADEPHDKLSMRFKIYPTTKEDKIFSVMHTRNERVLNQLTQCQNASINGYSALGAAMLAPDISLEKRCAFIQELIEYGFKPTLQDLQLAELILYDAIIENRKESAFKYLLYPNGSKPWFVLPQDIKILIAQYMMIKFKKDYWLLPGFDTHYFKKNEAPDVV